MDIFKMLEEHYISADAICGSLMEGVIIASSDGNFLYWNGPARFYMGNHQKDVRPEEWAREYRIYDLKGERLLDQKELPLVRALSGEEFHENRYLTKNINFPEGIILSVSGRPLRSGEATVGAVITFRDITQEIELEKDIKFQSDFYKNVLDLLPGNVLIKDLNQKYIYGNKSFLELLHTNSIQGKEAKDFFTTEMSEKIRKHDQLVVESGQAKTFEEVIYWGDNTRSIFLATRFPYRDSNQKIKGICTVFTDVTKDYEAERESHIEKEKYIHASKLAVIGTISFQISQKIIDPLGRIKSLNESILQNLQKNQIDFPLLKRMIGEIDHTIENIHKAAGNLDKFDELRKNNKKEKTTLNEVFLVVEGLVGKKLKRSEVTLVIDTLKCQDLELTTNRIQLTELILNMIIISLAAVEESDKRKISIFCGKSENLDVTIVHSCPGKNLSGITTKEGFAWSISQSICEQQGWSLSYESNDEQGNLILKIPINR